jgi:hypothetical protein
MASDVSVVVAESSRMAAIRQSIRFPGRVMHFTPGGVGSAMEAVRNYKPRTVAIDAVFGQTPLGVAFMDRIDALGIADSSIKFIVEHEGRWITASRRGATAGPLPAETPAPVRVPEAIETTAAIEAAPPALVAAIAAAVEEAVPPSTAASSTRRAPRFPIQGAVGALVENGRASVVDMSALGAQLVSLPALRPNQRIMVSLQDENVSLNVIAQVAWSSFERPTRDVEPYYRAGIEFTGPSRDALEDYRQRHCASKPIPIRSK